MSETVYKKVCVAPVCKEQVHIIEPGDTLYSIALKYHTRVRILLAMNPFVDVYHLRPGDEICIPYDKPPKEETIPYVIKEGDTIGKILKESGNTFEELSRQNPYLLEMPLVPGNILLFPAEKEETEKIDKQDGKTYNK